MASTFNPKIFDDIEKEKQRWEEALAQAFAAREERLKRFSTVSDREISRLYTPSDNRGQDFGGDIGFPGEYPFTRGVQPSMYRGRLWTMRMFAGLGCAKDTNERFHLLVNEGQTGLSTAFDMPTLMGYDTDSLRARGECGRCGVAIDTLEDMEDLFNGLPIDRITTSMTINPPAPVIWAMYIAMAENRGIDRKVIGGTIQNDMLKEFIAQRINGICHSGFFSNDLLGPKCNGCRFFRRQGQCFVQGIGVKGLGPTENCGQGLKGCADHIIKRLLGCKRTACSLRVKSQPPGSRVLGLESLLHDLCPDTSGRPVLGDLFKKINV